jgi:hypothetical protein
VLCAVTILPADLRLLSLYYYAVCGRMLMSSVRVWCSCLLVICCELFRNVCVAHTVSVLVFLESEIIGHYKSPQVFRKSLKYSYVRNGFL